jgi:histidine ammonia-lyase
MRTVVVNGDALTVQDVIDVARGEARAELAPGVPARMEASRQVVAEAIAGDAPSTG